MVEPEVVVVPAGDALLGDPPRTQHVNVFAIARLPVTVAEYAQFLEENEHAPPPGWETPGVRGRDDPVHGVSWADAVAYCRALTVKTGRIYRLPDEREWEKAARGGTLSGPRALKEWTNSWLDGGRVVRSAAEPAVRLFARDDVRGVGFRLVRGMTGR